MFDVWFQVIHILSCWTGWLNAAWTLIIGCWYSSKSILSLFFQEENMQLMGWLFVYWSSILCSFSQNDIQNSVEWSSNIYHPLHPRLEGDVCLINAHCISLLSVFFFISFSLMLVKSCSHSSPSSSSAKVLSSQSLWSLRKCCSQCSPNTAHL